MKKSVWKRIIVAILSVTMIACLAICFSSCDFIDFFEDKYKLSTRPNDGVLFYELSDDGSYYIVEDVVDSSITEAIIPDTFRDIPVKSIGDGAFSSCSSLTSVTIGNGVTSIGDWAFSGCSSLKSVYITDIAAWCNITFESDSSNPLYYADNFYLNGEFVKEIVIPEGVTIIGAYAFCNYDFFTSVTIPNSVTSIGDSAFESCTSLTSVTIPDSVTSIGRNAFDFCMSLTSVTIPDSVTSIGLGAFA